MMRYGSSPLLEIRKLVQGYRFGDTSAYLQIYS